MIKSKPYVSLLSALFIAGGLNPINTQAGTQADYRALQEWCVGRNNLKPGQDYPNPEKYFHFQHYCFAMTFMDKIYSAKDTTSRNFNSSEAQNNIKYIIDRVPETHFLLPELYAMRGQAQALIKQNSQAELSLLKALQLDPGHIGAYSTLALLYRDTKRDAKAAEIVEAGLKVNPEHKGLRRLAKNLGIKLEPIAIDGAQPKTVTAPADPSRGKPATPAAPAPDQTAKTPAPASPAGTQTEAKPVTQDMAPAATEKTSPTIVPPAPVKIGSPTNPWCRFCTEIPEKDPGSSTPVVAPKAAP